METLEYLLKLSRQAEEQAQELRATIDRIIDVPVKTGNRCVHSELIESGYARGGEGGDYGHGTAWSACTRIVEQRQAMLARLADLQSEAEILTSIADDLIGKTGRLV